MQMSAPDAFADQATYLDLVKEYNALTPIVDAYRTYLRLCGELEEAQRMVRLSSDPDLAQLAGEEAELLAERKEACEAQIRALLRPRDPRDDRNVIVEIRAGAGGEESALFVADLYRMYQMYCQAHGWRIEILYQNPTELGGYREIDFTVTGQGAFSRLKYESGVHRVQRVPKTESQGRIQTSTVTVAILTEVDSVEVSIQPQDIKMESCKSSGAGGQHINKTESAVRLTHLPTGIAVECQEERSQLRNREKAMKLLEAKLYHIKCSEQNEQIASERKKQVGTGERSEKIRTYNYPQSRVTDHRIGYTVHTLDKFLNGDMDVLIDALQGASEQ